LLAACLLCGATTVWAQQPTVKISTDDKAVTVLANDQPLMKYCYAGVPFKPYCQTFMTPGGVNILRDSPSDHKHHHALMFAVGVNGVSYWEETEKGGFQQHRNFSDTRLVKTDDVPWATFTESLDWVAPNTKETVLTEQRTIEATRMDALKASVLRWQTRLEVPAGKKKAELGGGHYYGLGMRFVTSMDQMNDFIFPNDEKGELVRGDEYLTNATWCAYSALADGKPVTVAMFDHPGNPRPAKWFTMHTHFAYLSATMNYWKEPMEVTEGKPVTMRYCVALWDGKVDKAAIEAAYQRWLTWPAPEAEKRLD
jgi:hypothetical protein